MRPMLLLALTLTASVFLSPIASAGLAQRMNACFRQIKSEPNGRAFAKGWTGECQIPAEALEYQPDDDDGGEETIAARSFIEEGAACTTPLPKSVALNPALCGMPNKFVETYTHSVIRVSLPNGRCVHVIPLLLTDKTKGFSCTAVRARVACVTKIERNETVTNVTLATVSAGLGSVAMLSVNENSKPSDLAYQQAAGQPFIALMPASFDNYGEVRFAVPFIASQLKRLKTKCEEGHTKQHCAQELSYHAERLMVEQLRRAWTPRTRISPADKTSDRTAFAVALKDVAEKPSTPKDQKALLQSIVANEIGEDSPYQVMDAITDMSGPSWGANQIDIGANGDSEIDLFWKIANDWKSSNPDSQLGTAGKYRACLSAPIRHYYVSQLNTFYSSVPDFNRALRAPSGQQNYNSFFINWLVTETERAGTFSGLFGVSAFARIFYVDVHNQFGGKQSRQVKQSAESFSPNWFSRCDSIKAEENGLVTSLRERVSDVRKNDLDRRVKNMHAALKKIYGDSEGRVGCD